MDRENNVNAADRFSALERHEASPDYATRRFFVRGPVQKFTDTELLELCEYTPEFGGRVARGPQSAIVIVHTD